MKPPASARRTRPYVALLVLATALLAACGGGARTAAVPSLQPTSVTTQATSPARTPFVVAISAGHGGPQNVGAVHTNTEGAVDLVEKDLNLDVARRLDALLRADGYRTILIRDGDYSLAPPVPDFNESVRLESQARADIANAAGADIILALHFNGSDDAAQSGTEVYYNPDRAFGDRSRMLATFVDESLLAGIRALGYDTRDRGIMNDASIGARFDQAHTFLLGEAAGFRPTEMPGVICEPLFVSNDVEAALLQRDDMRQAIAAAYKAGIDRYVRWLEGGEG